MKISLLAVGQRPPSWVQEGFLEYARRLRGISLELTEIAPGRRGAGIDRAREEEARRILKALPRGARLVLLDERGELLDSRGLAGRLQGWQESGGPVALVIGGPDGVAETVRAAARETLALSRLTLPHALVRVLLAEQVYRAWTILQGHPYHRD
ncbi:MAG: 23S rRNA (pseudouridine(1915)-N(3))-methyltransferase RlmH [Gammaproteobacteria bacterium]|nr:MAG: 23S rRNA (pseudouridine(1915)-N(3))-methyltransferase RlmH [Gammaproteobacteria bacterium]